MVTYREFKVASTHVVCVLACAAPGLIFPYILFSLFPCYWAADFHTIWLLTELDSWEAQAEDLRGQEWGAPEYLYSFLSASGGNWE